MFESAAALKTAPGADTANSLTGPGTATSLTDVLDGLLDTGVVADGQIVLSVAGVDLIFLGLRALLASMDTAARMRLAPPPAPRGPEAQPWGPQPCGIKPCGMQP